MAHFMHHTAALAARVSRIIVDAANGATRIQAIEGRFMRSLSREQGTKGQMLCKRQEPSGYRVLPSLPAGQSARNTTLSRPALDWCPSVRIPPVAVS